MSGCAGSRGMSGGLTPTPAPAQDRQGLATISHPQGELGQEAAQFREAELDPWEEPAQDNAGNDPARLGGSWLGKA